MHHSFFKLITCATLLTFACSGQSADGLTTYSGFNKANKINLGLTYIGDSINGVYYLNSDMILHYFHGRVNQDKIYCIEYNNSQKPSTIVKGSKAKNFSKIKLEILNLGTKKLSIYDATSNQNSLTFTNKSSYYSNRKSAIGIPIDYYKSIWQLNDLADTAISNRLNKSLKLHNQFISPYTPVGMNEDDYDDALKKNLTDASEKFEVEPSLERQKVLFFRNYWLPVFKSEKILVLENNFEYYNDLKHIEKRKKVLNFDMCTGGVLGFEQIFDTSSYTKLESLISLEIKKQKNLETGNRFSEDGYFYQGFSLPQNFYILPQGIIFLYNMSEISNWQTSNAIFIYLSKQKLKLLLNKANTNPVLELWQ